MECFFYCVYQQARILTVDYDGWGFCGAVWKKAQVFFHDSPIYLQAFL